MDDRGRGNGGGGLGNKMRYGKMLVSVLLGMKTWMVNKLFKTKYISQFSSLSLLPTFTIYLLSLSNLERDKS